MEIVFREFKIISCLSYVQRIPDSIESNVTPIETVSIAQIDTRFEYIFHEQNGTTDNLFKIKSINRMQASVVVGDGDADAAAMHTIHCQWYTVQCTVYIAVSRNRVTR